MSSRTILILLASALTLGAQGRFRSERPRRDFAQGRENPRRERIEAMLHEIRTRKLRESLGLPDEKARAIADRWSQFDGATFSRRQQMAQLRQQMNGTLMGPGTEEEKNRKVQPVVDQLADLRQQQRNARRQFEEDIEKSLTPAQQGRFILLMDEMQKNIQDAIQERRRDQ